ncbi:BTB/POZ and MATH domain-containing protein 2 [Rhynchospora pubera]|uniref:BTB/POZ and MATH domain-containing protein 2 n=1 Tax=Rhynchospora pubera TaxID=906938 RepID=A0AAV8EN30_9POAL|nr:BTB/POZ and MATH domain-containing protein 2 [Rhynchospora pubera]
MSLSDGDSSNIPETASTLRVEKVTGSHLFKIMGYSLQTDIAKKKFLESATFSVGGYDWSIHYYPNGVKSTEEDYTSIFVLLKSEAKYVKAQPSFIILNENRNPLSARLTTEVYTFTSDNKDSYGFPKFVKRSALQSLSGDLKNDCIVIRCTVTVFKTFPVEVEPAFPLPVPPPDMQQLSHLLEAGYGADVTFKVNGQRFNAHKHILAAKSQVFLAQFFGPLKENKDKIIKIEDMEAPVFNSLLHFIYSETVPEFEEVSGSKKKHNNELAQHLLVAADRYDLDRLKIICQNILYGSIDRGNVVALLSLAEMHNCINLKTACLKFIASPGILGEVTATEQFQCLVRNHPLILKELLDKWVL